GLMDRVATWPSQALNHPQKGKLTGIGLTPEAIEQNPVVYELMMENAWRRTPIDLTAWLKGYTHRRYGQENTSANQAWDILRRTVYADSVANGGPESIIVGRPTFERSTGGATTNFTYSQTDLVKAWELLFAAAPELNASQG